MAEGGGASISMSIAVEVEVPFLILVGKVAYGPFCVLLLPGGRPRGLLVPPGCHAAETAGFLRALFRGVWCKDNDDGCADCDPSGMGNASRGKWGSMADLGKSADFGKGDWGTGGPYLDGGGPLGTSS